MSALNEPTLPPTTAQLVSAAYILKAQIDAAQADLDQIEAKLLALGRGRYPGLLEPETATVVAAVPASVGDPSYRLRDQDEIVARALAGVSWVKLFDRKVIFAPCPGFAEVTPKLLTPAKSRDLLRLCKVDGKVNSGRKGHVKYA